MHFVADIDKTGKAISDMKSEAWRAATKESGGCSGGR
jgi:hypothetical protein